MQTTGNTITTCEIDASAELSKSLGLLESLNRIEVIGLIGNNRKNFEFGVGYTFQIYLKTYLDFITSEKIYQDSYYLRTYLPIRLGYRYQKPEGGLFFRIGYTPVIQYSSEDKRGFFSPLFGGLSIGKSF